MSWFQWLNIASIEDLALKYPHLRRYCAGFRLDTRKSEGMWAVLASANQIIRVNLENGDVEGVAGVLGV